MKALEVHSNFDQTQKNSFILFTLGVICFKLAVQALTMFLLMGSGIGHFDTNITDIIMRIITFLMSWTQATTTYRFIILLWCIKIRFNKINDYIRFVSSIPKIAFNNQEYFKECLSGYIGPGTSRCCNKQRLFSAGIEKTTLQTNRHRRNYK